MKLRVMQILRGVVLSVVLGAGLLAIVYLEEPFQNHQAINGKFTLQKADWRQSYPETAMVKPDQSSPAVLGELKAQMAGDELLGRSPFANLSASDPLETALKNVSAFERHTLRSPSYLDDAGYDLVHYEILHAGGGLSQILAYVADGQVVVMVLTPNGPETAYAQYAGGDLMEVKNMPSNEGESLFANQLESSVPFLSVSR